MCEKIIPLLTEKDIECRVQQVTTTKYGTGVILLLYKNARVDMRILDQIYGPTGWQRTHEVINGNLFCNIDIWDEDKKCWIRKQDVGTESNTEKQKGEASDAFKRAGTNVGIGRELYTAPFIYVKLDEDEFFTDKSGKTICSKGLKFSASEIGYNERREINHLVIRDKDGRQRFFYGDKNSKPAQTTHKAVEQAAAPAKHNLTIEQVEPLYKAAERAGYSRAQVDSTARTQLHAASVRDLTDDQFKNYLSWFVKKYQEQQEQEADETVDDLPFK